MRLITLCLGLVFLAVSTAHAEALVTATLDARTGDILECSIVNPGGADEQATPSIVDAVGGALLAGGALLNVPAGLATSVSYTVPFSGPKQAYCEVVPDTPEATLRASLKRLSGSRQAEDSSDATSPGAAVTTASQYIPYAEAIVPGLNPNLVCASAGAGFGSNRLVIDSDAPFTVTSILVQPLGFDDAASDFFQFLNLAVDNIVFPFSTPDLATSAMTLDTPFDVLGGSIPGAGDFINAPLALSSKGSPFQDDDIHVTLRCDAGATSDTRIQMVQVHGWRRADAPVVVTLEP